MNQDNHNRSHSTESNFSRRTARSLKRSNRTDSQLGKALFPAANGRSPAQSTSRNRRSFPGRSSATENGNGVSSSSTPKLASSGRSRRDSIARLPRQPKGKKNRPRKLRSLTPLLYGVRLLILLIGFGIILGTTHYILTSSKKGPADASQADTAEALQSKPANLSPSPWQLQQEISPLKAQLEKLATQTPQLQPGVFLIDLDTSNYLDLNGSKAFSAASTIKVPVLVAFFQAVDAGKIRLDEQLTLKTEFITGGSGEMQGHPPGTQYTALETATKMIVISDNTATNILIDRLGGSEKLNQRFQEWGLEATAINNPLADLEGTNKTSPKDLAKLMALVNKGELVSLRSRDRLLNIMEQTLTKTLLPRGLGKGATIAHKTGDIGSMVGDIGLIDMPNGKRYITAVMVSRPHNDSRAQELIRQISHNVYQHLNKPIPSPAQTTPSETTSPSLNSSL